MSKRHLKTINAPKSWPVERKTKYWVSRPNPGPHSFKESLPLSVVFNDLLSYVKNIRELKKILNQGIVKINGKIRKDYKYPMGIFDVLELSGKECYRLLYNDRGKFYLSKIKDKEVLFKITDKKILNKKRLQLNFSNGNNILTDNKDIQTGDSITLDGGKVKTVLKFEKNSTIYLTGGRHVGIIGKVKGIEGNKVLFTSEKEEFETLKKYAFVIGKEKPIIDIENE